MTGKLLNLKNQNQQPELNPDEKSTDRWRTPDEVLAPIRALGGGRIALDPATEADNPVGADRWFTREQDGLAQSWDADGIVFVNPPYSRPNLDLWSKKAWDESVTHDHGIVLLVSADVSVAWYRNLRRLWASARCDWEGRIRFNRPPDVPLDSSGAGFASTIFYLGPDPFLFCHHLRRWGDVEVLKPRP
jgi:phage N-6-adenine-methyltransferase